MTWLILSHYLMANICVTIHFEGIGWLVNILVFLFVVDLFLFGGGRLVDFGGVTLRMIIFCVAVMSALTIIIVKMRGDRTAFKSVFFSSVILLIASILSLINGDEVYSSSTYFFVMLAIFFSIYPDRIFYVMDKTIRGCSLFMAITYLIFICFVIVGSIPIASVYYFIPDSEVFLRGKDAFVYKGFIFILIGALHFSIVKRGSVLLRMLGLAICLIAILATLTRGFVISFLMVILIYYQFNIKMVSVKVIALLVIITGPILLYLIEPSFFFRSGSDSVRLHDISVFFDIANANIGSFLFGHGVSASLGDRANIENAYMDITLRFGVVGLILVLSILVKITVSYVKIMKLRDAKIDKTKIKWLFYSVLLIFIQSNFNPYVNNYIGGSFVIFAMIYFNSVMIRYRD